MPSSFLIVICYATVFSLAPLALYLLWLSIISRRHRPTVVMGAWDFAILLCGLSGFILFGGGLVLSLMQSNVRFLLRGNFEALRDAWGKEHLAWSLTAIVYLLFVGGGSFLTLQSRRRSLVVYNVEPDPFEAVLSEVFEHLGLAVERRGNMWVSGVPLCEVERFAAGHTVTVRWLSEDMHLFQEVDRRIREAVRSLFTSENPSARWFSSGVVALGSLISFALVLILYYTRKL